MHHTCVVCHRERCRESSEFMRVCLRSARVRCAAAGVCTCVALCGGAASLTALLVFMAWGLILMTSVGFGSTDISSFSTFQTNLCRFTYLVMWLSLIVVADIHMVRVRARHARRSPARRASCACDGCVCVCVCVCAYDGSVVCVCSAATRRCAEGSRD
jgi:hypothetical protein